MLPSAPLSGFGTVSLSDDDIILRIRSFVKHKFHFFHFLFHPPPAGSSLQREWVFFFARLWEISFPRRAPSSAIGIMPQTHIPVADQKILFRWASHSDPPYSAAAPGRQSKILCHLQFQPSHRPTNTAIHGSWNRNDIARSVPCSIQITSLSFYHRPLNLSINATERQAVIPSAAQVPIVMHPPAAFPVLTG